MEEATQGNASGDIQRSVGHDRNEANVPRVVPKTALPHAGFGLLRVDHYARRQEASDLFQRADGEPITFAAIQDAWNNPETGERIRSCSMVITEANKFVSDVHDRMPVILEPEDIEQWERGDVKDAAALMKPANEGLLQKWPVSARVNSSRTPGDDSSLIERGELPPIETAANSLF